VAAAPVVGGRSPAAQPTGTGGVANGTNGTNGVSSNSANGNGNSANGGSSAASGQPAGTSTGTPATASWAAGGTTTAGRGAGESRPAAEPPASAAPAPGSQAGTTDTSGTWSVSSSYSSESSSSGGYAADTGAARPASSGTQPGYADAADPIAEVPVQPASDGGSEYVPSAVSFVSDDDEEYGATDGYSGYDRDRGSDAAPGWKDSGRTGKDKVFDVNAGRRRPVVFEEEDDLDVPDFLK
jgi:hypothetical protein